MPMDLGDTFDPAPLARLARLDLDDRERTLFTEQLRLMIRTFNRIAELPTDGVEAFTHTGDPLLAVREDEPRPDGDGGGGLIAVPPIFGKPPGGTR